MMIDNEHFTDLISRVEKSIHRIDLYIHPKLFAPLLRQFQMDYNELQQNRIPIHGGVITSFRFNTGEHGPDDDFAIRRIDREGGNYPSYFISITNHTVEFRRDLTRIIKSIISDDAFLRATHPNNACSVYYVESPLDFYPKHRADIHCVFNYLAAGLFLKGGRRGGHTVFEPTVGKGTKTHKCPTLYIGKRIVNPEDENSSAEWNINIRNDLHGLRLYYRPTDQPPSYIRLEYVANKKRLKALGLRTLVTLSDITPDRIRPLDYVLYREQSDKKVHEDVIEKQSGPDLVDRSTILKARTRIYAHQSLVRHGLHYIDRDEAVDPEVWKDKMRARLARSPYNFLEIAARVDAFKELNERYDLRHNVDFFYPKDKDKLVVLKSMVGYP